MLLNSSRRALLRSLKILKLRILRAGKCRSSRLKSAGEFFSRPKMLKINEVVKNESSLFQRDLIAGEFGKHVRAFAAVHSALISTQVKDSERVHTRPLSSLWARFGILFASSFFQHADECKVIVPSVCVPSGHSRSWGLAVKSWLCWSRNGFWKVVQK